ncbi:AMP-dependent synthetase, partial [Corallococcus praedator]
MKSALDTAIDAVVDGIIAPGGMMAVGIAPVGGIRLPVFVNAPANLRDYLALFFGAQADKEFVVYRDERLSFAAVYA